MCSAPWRRPSSVTPFRVRPAPTSWTSVVAVASLVLTSLEDYGFCGKGEAAAFVGDGRIRLGGELPLNTAGGLLSEGYIHGWNLILEGVRQIRGTSTAQVEDVEFSLVTSGWGAPTSALILSR